MRNTPHVIIFPFASPGSSSVPNLIFNYAKIWQYSIGGVRRVHNNTFGISAGVIIRQFAFGETRGGRHFTSNRDTSQLPVCTILPPTAAALTYRVTAVSGPPPITRGQEATGVGACYLQYRQGKMTIRKHVLFTRVVKKPKLIFIASKEVLLTDDSRKIDFSNR